MTLNEILDGNYLSIRAYNVCRFNNLYNLQLILDFYSKNHTFKNLRNCGDGTNRELISFCKIKHGECHFGNKPSTKEKRAPYLSILEGLTRKQREVISSFIAINIDGLSIRSKNAVKSYLLKNFKVKGFVQMLLPTSFDVSMIGGFCACRNVHILIIVITLFQQ